MEERGRVEGEEGRREEEWRERNGGERKRREECTPVFLGLFISLLLLLAERDKCFHGGEEEGESSLHLRGG